MARSVMKGHYEKTVDRESAYEYLQAKALQEKEETLPEGREEKPHQGKPGRKPDTIIEKMSKTAASSAGRQIARELVRGILGSLLRK